MNPNFPSQMSEFYVCTVQSCRRSESIIHYASSSSPKTKVKRNSQGCDFAELLNNITTTTFGTECSGCTNLQNWITWSLAFSEFLRANRRPGVVHPLLFNDKLPPSIRNWSHIQTPNAKAGQLLKAKAQQCVLSNSIKGLH
jgi:hypothetical protein